MHGSPAAPATPAPRRSGGSTSGGNDGASDSSKEAATAQASTEPPETTLQQSKQFTKQQFRNLVGNIVGVPLRPIWGRPTVEPHRIHKKPGPSNQDKATTTAILSVPFSSTGSSSSSSPITVCVKDSAGHHYTSSSPCSSDVERTSAVPKMTMIFVIKVKYVSRISSEF